MIAIPRAPDGTPLVDMQVVGEVLEKYPDLRMSFEEYLALDEDVHNDWIDGRLRLLGGETFTHQGVSGYLASAMGGYVKLKELGEVWIRCHMRARPDLPCREVDLMYIAREHRGRFPVNFVDGPADLVVEIVSDESREVDRVEKFSEYERGGVREYWLVDPFLERAEIFRLDAEGRYRAVQPGDPPRLRSEVIPGFWLDPAWLWDEDASEWVAYREWGLI